MKNKNITVKWSETSGLKMPDLKILSTIISEPYHFDTTNLTIPLLFYIFYNLKG